MHAGADCEGSLIELVFTDEEVRRQPRLHLDILADLGLRVSGTPDRREDDPILLFTTERMCDALAHGEIETKDLGLDRAAIVEALVQQVIAALA
jgi:hypothetical protein